MKKILGVPFLFQTYSRKPKRPQKSDAIVPLTWTLQGYFIHLQVEEYAFIKMKFQAEEFIPQTKI